jgi:hypothetical protein
MKKIVSIMLSCTLYFFLFGCGESSQTTPQNSESVKIQDSQKTDETVDAPKECVEETGGVEKIIGDWFGQTEIHTDYNDGTFDAVLSINADNTWASCVDGDFNWGTWETASEKGNRIVLTVQYEGTDGTNEWSFEKHPDGYYYEYVHMETIEFKMTKLESEPADQIYNDWYGEITYIDEYDNEEEEAKTSISINSDGTWSSSVSGANNNGNIRYVSESGHLIILDVVYEGVDRTNQWGVVKKADGQFYYEYYHGQLIEIPINPL